MRFIVEGNRELYSRNIRLLEKRFPGPFRCMSQPNIEDPISPAIAEIKKTESAICVRRSDGPGVLLDDAASVNRLIEQMAAAKRPEAYDVIFILGIGTGTACLEAVNKLGENRPLIVIIEPCTVLFSIALQTVDLTKLLTYKRLSLHVGIETSARDIVEFHKKTLPLGRTILFVHPYPSALVGNYYRQWESELVHHIRTVRDMWHTVRRSGNRMLMNSIANLNSLFSGTPMRLLRNRFKGVPAICVAAGPTLDEALPLLRQIKGALIIACDSAVNPLMASGIQPHFVATADIYPTNIAKLKPYMEKLRETVLVFGVESNPENVRTYLGERRVGVTAYNKLVLNWLDTKLNFECKFSRMTSVTHLALSFAAALGADPLILVGVDLAFIHGHSHSAGSAFYHHKDVKRLIEVPGVGQTTVHAPEQLVTDRIILEEIISQLNCRVISTSLKGALINGVEIKSLQEVMDTVIHTEKDLTPHFDSIQWHTAATDETVTGELSRLIAEFQMFKDGCLQQADLIARYFDCSDSCGKLMGDNKLLLLIKNGSRQFHATNQKMVALIEESFLDELQEAFKMEAVCAALSKGDKSDRIHQEILVLKRKFDIYANSIESLINHLKRMVREATHMLELKRRNSLVDLARFYHEIGEVWQAIKSCRGGIETSAKADAYMELARLYAVNDYYQLALETLKEARSADFAGSRPGQLKEEIERKIDGLLEKIENACRAKDSVNARQWLAAYLAIRPDDPKALEIQTAMQAEIAGSSHPRKEDSAAPNRLSVRLEQAAEMIKKQNFEESSAILEGICAEFPQAGAMLREQIGDVRSMQKDFISARWNFSQAVKHNPENLTAKNKLNALLKDGKVVN